MVVEFGEIQLGQNDDRGGLALETGNSVGQQLAFGSTGLARPIEIPGEAPQCAARKRGGAKKDRRLQSLGA